MTEVTCPQPSRDSARWWEETRSDAGRLIDWLFDQYRGEVTAASRIDRLRDTYALPGTRAHRVLTVIAGQERRHASWVAELLRARGLSPEVRGEPEARYWARTLPGITDLETGCAVGAHAERMRLERIEVIAADPGAPADLRDVFRRILQEERFHEKAFRALATPESLARTREAHALGREVLGLVP
jgi:rubrerythrin